MTAKEQQLEGEFRYVNSRIVTNSEEIAFYQGDQKERSTVELYFGKLIAHLRALIKFRLGMGFVDHIVAKYLATTVGYLSVSIPFLDHSTPRFLEATPEKLRGDYYRYVVQSPLHFLGSVQFSSVQILIVILTPKFKTENAKYTIQ